MANLQLTFLDVRRDFASVERIWRALTAPTNDSYFLSWSWVENWLAVLPPKARIRLAVAGMEGDPKLAFFLGWSRVLRHSVFSSRACFLNETGIAECDDLYIERNSMLSATGLLSLPDLLALLPFSWDEFFLSGVSTDSFPGNCFQDDLRPYRLHILATRPAPYVDLQRVRRNGGDYLGLLSSNTRSQVRRAYRQYEQRGPVECQVAETLPECLDFFEEMVRLHQQSWRTRGQAGAFASPFFYRFHRRLIETYHRSGEIQLLRVSAGGSPIGCTYSFLYRGRVHFYQGGLAYESDNRLKPGLICHAEAIRRNATAGHSIYDFLGGAARYKQSLATDETPLVWAKIQKPRVKFWVENKLAAISRLKKHPKPNTALLQESF